MGAVRVLVGVTLRRRWRSVAVLTLVVGVTGGAVLATVAGARRTASSFDRFVEESGTADAFVATDLHKLDVTPIERLPDVAAVTVIDPVAAEVAADKYVPVAASVDGHYGRSIDRARLIAGRRERRGAVDEMAITESTAKTLGLGVGDYATVHTYTPQQVPLLTGQNDPPGAGPTVRMRIVGVERSPSDVGTSFEESAVIVLPSGFLRRYGDQIGRNAGLAFRVRLASGHTGVPAFIRAAQRIYGREHVEVQPVSFESATVQDQLSVLSTGLLLLAAVAALAGVVAIGQAIAREMFRDAVEHPALHAIGMTTRERAAALLGPAAIVIGAGTLTAIAVALAASPLMPIGVAGRAEPAPGMSFDGLALSLGAVAMAALVLAVAAIAAWRFARRAVSSDQGDVRVRPSAIARKLANARAGPAAVIGVRMALEKGRDRTAVPVRSALIGTVVGVVGVIATLVFATSLDRLVATPRRYGWGWDVLASTRLKASDLRRDAAVRGLSEARFFNLELGGRPVNAIGVRRIEGSVFPTILAGRAPHRASEVALGSETLDDLDLEPGDHVRASGPDGRGTLRVVGKAVFASVDDRAVLADGAVLTERGLARFVANDDAGKGGYSVYLVRFAAGASQTAAIHRFARESGDTPEGPRLPPGVDHLTQVDQLPFVLAGFLALLATLALIHALVTASRSQRRDFAVLRVLGFVRRQLRSAVAWHASAVAVVGLVVGIPLGVVVGKLAWGRVAAGLGVATDAAVPLIALIVTIPAALILAGIVAVMPARGAAHAHTAVTLRTE